MSFMFSIEAMVVGSGRDGQEGQEDQRQEEYCFIKEGCCCTGLCSVGENRERDNGNGGQALAID